MPTFAIYLALAMAVAAATGAGTQNPGDTPPAAATNTAATNLTAAVEGPPLPEGVVPRLRAEMPALADHLTDVARVRRYRAVLRGGREAMRENPRAGDLYLVQSLMLQAMQKLVEFQTDDVQADEVLTLARDIVASHAPPAWKFNADALLTDIEVSKAAANPGKDRPSPATRLLTQFVDRYRESDELRVQALRQAITMARQTKQDDFVNQGVNELYAQYANVPAAREFLRQEMGRRWGGGESLLGEFSLLDGRTVRLPEDYFGKYVLVHGWNPEIARCDRELKGLKAFRDKYRNAPMEVLSVCTGTSREALERTLKDEGVDWPQIFSGKGAQDPFVRMYGIVTVPYYAVIGPDGRVWDGGGTDRMTSTIQRSWRRQVRLDNARSGMFMVRALVDLAKTNSGAAVREPTNAPAVGLTLTTGASTNTAASGVGQAALRGATNAPALLGGNAGADRWEGVVAKAMDAYGAFPFEVREQRIDALRRGCAEMEAAEPASARLATVRALRLAADEWLAFKRADAVLQREGLALAQQIVDSKPSAPQRVLADYVLARQRAVDPDLDWRDASKRTREFAAMYRKTPEEWLALPLAASLAYEVGNVWLADEYRRAMGDDKIVNEHPEIRALLRTALEWGLDQNAAIKGSFTRLDGSTLNVPEDVRGKVVVIHFWTATAEPGAPWTHMPSPYGWPVNPADLLSPTKDMIVIAANLDRSPEAAEALAKQHPEWIVTHSPQGLDDPMARRFDLYPFPSTWVLTQNGHGFLSDEAMSLDGPVNWAMDRLWHAGNDPLSNADQWKKAFDETERSKELVETTVIVTTNKWQLRGDWLTRFEEGTERVAAEGMRIMGEVAQRRGATLMEKLNELSPAEGGGWGPTNVVHAANEDIAAILDVKHKLDSALELRAGMQWAGKPEVSEWLRTAAEEDCLHVPITPEGEEQRKTVAKFFVETPVAPAAANAATNTPAANAPASGFPAYRLFRVKPL